MPRIETISIEEALFIVGIPITKPADLSVRDYTVIGRVDCWTFDNKLSYRYIEALAPQGQGLPLDTAIELHERAYPFGGEVGPQTYGKVIRVNGDAHAAHPLRQSHRMRNGHHVIWVDEPSPEQRSGLHEVFTEADLRARMATQTIDKYHIDTLAGLAAFVRTIS